MRPFLTLAVIVVAACGAQSTEPTFGVETGLKMNAVVRIPDDTTTVRFTAVTSDSRCPSNAQCVWAGDATVVFLVGGTQQVALHTEAGNTSAIIAGRKITLLRLAPTPAVGKAIAQGDYVATIRFDKALD